MPGELALESGAYYFGCSACGKCCNAAPRMTLPELFHHQHRFVGCLGVRRLPGVRAELFAHAFSYVALAACPALQSDGRCAVHDDRKPRICSVVPLDGALADTEQHALLQARRDEALYMGADCIREQPSAGFREVTRRLRVVDPDAQQQLALYRADQAAERHFWGERTARLLGPDLLDRPERVRALRPDAVFTLSLVPTLSVIAETSARCRERVIVYLDAQRVLCAQLIDEALGRRDPAERGETNRLRNFLAAAQRFAAILRTQPALVAPSSAGFVSELEAWLGVA